MTFQNIYRAQPNTGQEKNCAFLTDVAAFYPNHQPASPSSPLSNGDADADAKASGFPGEGNERDATSFRKSWRRRNGRLRLAELAAGTSKCHARAH